MPNEFRGLRVTRQGNTIFIPLPVDAWTVAAFDKCDCPHCKGRTGYWDTLCVSADAKDKKQPFDFTSTVHHPTLQPAGVYEAKWKEEAGAQP